jgi:hypothetical protein
MPAGSSTARAAIAGRDREAAAAAVSRTTLTPLLVAAGILLAGNGLQVTLVSCGPTSKASHRW